MASTNVVEIKDAGLNDFLKRLHAFDSYEAVAGINEKKGSQPHPNGNGLTVIEVAIINEFRQIDTDAGSGVRSFLRDTFDINKNKYDKILTKAANNVVKKKEDPRKALFQVAQTARTDIIERINSRIPPPNTAETIARKGSDIPLIDTRTMHDSIDGEVRTKGKS